MATVLSTQERNRASGRRRRREESFWLGMGKGEFSGEKAWRTSRDSVNGEGRLLMVEIKLRAKASRWEQVVQGREPGRLRGQELGCRRLAGSGARWWTA